MNYARIAELAYRTPQVCACGAQSEEEMIKRIFEADVSGIKHAFFFDARRKGDGQSDAQLYTLILEDQIIFACRGTESVSDAVVDISIWKEKFQDLIYCNNVDTNAYKNIKVHSGFLNQYNTIKYTIMATLYSHLWTHGGHASKKVICVGHSLGGALSTLAAACAKAHFGEKIHVSCFTFGSPRVGNRDFVRYFNDNVDVCERYVNGCDIITRVPKLFFSHVKGEKKIGAGAASCMESFFGSVEDHFMKNYKAALQGNTL